MTKELYKNKVKEFCSLMNVNDLSQKPTAQAIFDRINGRFTDDDMIRAFDDMVESEVSKLTYPTLKRYLTKYKEIRVSADLQRKKSQEKTDVENMMSHAEIKELVDIIIHKKPGTTPAPDFLKTNATIWTKDGRSLDAWIDPNDPNMQPGKAVTIVYEQQGDNMVRTQHIRLGMVKHKILTKIDRPPERKRAQSMFAPKVVEDDFIPELEVDENAFQDSFNMDGRPGGNA